MDVGNQELNPFLNLEEISLDELAYEVDERYFAIQTTEESWTGDRIRGDYDELMENVEEANYNMIDNVLNNMPHSRPDLFGNINHYDANGKKIGESRPGFFGGLNHYDD